MSVASDPDTDARLMAAAIRLGGRELGRTWPNPAVGALVVRDDGGGSVIVGRGWTRAGGRPHAETEALAEAGDRARGATCYVSLEPCSHHGRTPPCAEALANAGVARVVSALEDPDRRVSGRGHALLRAAGIAVEVGVCADLAQQANAGHVMRITEGRPRVTLKLAVSRDGMIAGPGGKPVAITGARARAETHMMRATHDAILVGIGTVLADDPQLTCRLPGMAERSPVRVVLDSRLRMPVEARLLQDQQVPVWTITGEDPPERLRGPMEGAGATVLPVGPGPGGRVSARAALTALAAQGITRVLIEGGAAVAASFVEEGLVDEAVIFEGPIDIGTDGVPAGSGLAEVLSGGAYRRAGHVSLGEDVMSTYLRIR